ncbi:MAG: topology modulation protein [Patescibacteria group bacterium]|nr:topology modulation protein [Patescibacteria group bacterium]MDE1945230.1 topology modulation protein [Patescibacteria group bacterium]MDE2057973.1 topology modulation protein [Patescibacteria group bacterium]
MEPLGKRIVVVGVSASGKSTFARKLAERTNLPLIHMDAIWWKPGWVEVSEEEATRQLEALTQRDEWVIEGYIPDEARPFVFERAESIVYLDYPRMMGAFRYIRRWWKHRKNPRPELKGSPEKFSWKFLKLVWSKGEAISLDTSLTEVAEQKKIRVIKKPQEAANLLKPSLR